MLYVRLAHPLEAVLLDEFHYPSKARPHLGGQRLKLVSNADVEQFNDPRHPFIVLHFCNTDVRPNLNAIMPACI